MCFLRSIMAWTWEILFYTALSSWESPLLGLDSLEMSPCQWSSAALGACSDPISCRDFLFCGVLDLSVNRPSLPRLFNFPCHHSSEDSDPLFKMTRKRRRRMMPLFILLKKDVLSHASPPGLTFRLLQVLLNKGVLSHVSPHKIEVLPPSILASWLFLIRGCRILPAHKKRSILSSSQALQQPPSEWRIVDNLNLLPDHYD